MSNLYFTADTHFGHNWMAEFRGEPTLADHDQTLTEQWNDLITNKDDVYHLGDFAFGDAEFQAATFARLNGKKHLVLGNHDSGSTRKLAWRSIDDFKRVRWEGRTFWCFHYPMLTWPNAHHGTYHLHGHSHGNLRAPTSTRMDIGIDATGRIAMSVEELDLILSARSYDYIDHHNKD